TATPATSTPAETTTTPASTTEEDTGGTAAPSEEQAQEGGAGDEEAVRTPAKYQATDGGLSPRTVTIPAFLAVEIRITSGDGKPHLAQVKAPGARDTVALPGQPAIIQLKGLKAGDYPIAIDGKGAGTLRVSKDAGGP
ncbi:MAG: hypothetical protein HZB46_16545, partial [Solirubrobacterales bacterium]|nr:hypothetical protein [Solirubrobacterales bacterium]